MKSVRKADVFFRLLGPVDCQAVRLSAPLMFETSTSKVAILPPVRAGQMLRPGAILWTAFIQSFFTDASGAPRTFPICKEVLQG